MSPTLRGRGADLDCFWRAAVVLAAIITSRKHQGSNFWSMIFLYQAATVPCGNFLVSVESLDMPDEDFLISRWPPLLIHFGLEFEKVFQKTLQILGEQLRFVNGSKR